MTTLEKLEIAEKMLSLFEDMPDLFKQQFAHHRDEHLAVIRSIREDLAEELAAN